MKASRAVFARGEKKRRGRGASASNFASCRCNRVQLEQGYSVLEKGEMARLDAHRRQV